MYNSINIAFFFILIYSRSVSISRGDPDAFFSKRVFAVVGASADPSKFGNKVLCCYKTHGKDVTPISKTPEIEGLASYPNLTEFVAALKAKNSSVDPASIGVSIVTPPAATLSVISEGLGLGIRQFFLQPGTANEAVTTLMNENSKSTGTNFVEGCVLVELGCNKKH